MATKAAPKAKVFDSIVGMFIHTLKDGFVENQGHIIGTDGDTVLIQLFSFMDGSPTNVRPMPRSVVLSDECRLYASENLWTEACEKDNRKRTAYKNAR